MNTSHGLFLVLAVIVGGLLQNACSKPSEAEQKTVELSQREQKEIRLREIDAQLVNWVSTGRPQDIERREALKNERVLLAADLGYAAAAPVSRPAAATMSQPPPELQATPAVVIAGDSSRYERRYQPMAPSSKWMDNYNRGRVYDRPILRRGSHIPWSDPNP
jgi:hypothetical protein